MAITEKGQWRFYKGPAPQIETRLIATGQGAYMPGAPCYITSSGVVKLAVTGASATDSLYGIILEGEATELAANTEIKVAKFHPDQWWILYCVSGGSDTAAVQTSVGDKLGIVVSATAGQIGYTVVEITDATNITVLVRDLMSNVEPSKYSTSDNPGAVAVSVLPAAIQAVNS